MSKARLTVTVDQQLVQAAGQAVDEGRVDSLSAWVNQALVERAARDRRLRALTDAVASYEADFGPITAAEIAAQERADRAGALVVRGGSRAATRRRRRHK
jgi:hypothetical protein